MLPGRGALAQSTTFQFLPKTQLWLTDTQRYYWLVDFDATPRRIQNILLKNCRYLDLSSPFLVFPRMSRI